MKTNFKFLILGFLMIASLASFSQAGEIKLNPEKVAKFSPYVENKFGASPGFEVWKSNNKMKYAQEMWYYTESFTIKRNHYNEGIVLNEEIIDISRFEAQRKPNEEVYIQLPGFKDAVVLLPGSQLIYKPN